jgi:hypothetical protein
MKQIEVDACVALLRIADSLEQLVKIIEEERDGNDSGEKSKEESS